MRTFFEQVDAGQWDVQLFVVIGLVLLWGVSRMVDGVPGKQPKRDDRGE